jgi:hypothetical protein
MIHETMSNFKEPVERLERPAIDLMIRNVALYSSGENSISDWR